MKSADFDNAWLTVKEAILEKFAGPPETGVYSPSVQHTLYQAEKTVLEKVAEVTSSKILQVLKTSDYKIPKNNIYELKKFLSHKSDLTPIYICFHEYILKLFTLSIL